ncbi:helix-turn-helix domain-containing protein [Streptomyces sp. NPDC048595]|uniref:helix-turn-helix domain-containing protein n=1 Tax=Streptomyces sp. NPDC048595 TaxID=3365576 RepID=UPI0037120FF7
MSRWKGLPASLDQRVRQLVVQLRRLKDHSGLSLASLAAKTAYSKSSWERYLNGKKLPPREAVEALARVCGTDPTRLLALHEVAKQAWEAGPPQPEAELTEAEFSEAEFPEPEPPAPARRRPGARGLAALGVLALLVVAAVALLLVRPWQDDAPAGPDRGAKAAARAPGAVPAFTHRAGETYACHVRRTGAGLYAGRSRTATAILGNGTSGWEAVEAQCLLRHRGYDPGPVDGIVGENTMRAAKRLQQAAGLPVDGIVGPDTWKALRR